MFLLLEQVDWSNIFDALCVGDYPQPILPGTWWIFVSVWVVWSSSAAVLPPSPAVDGAQPYPSPLPPEIKVNCSRAALKKSLKLDAVNMLNTQATRELPLWSVLCSCSPKNLQLRYEASSTEKAWHKFMSFETGDNLAQPAGPGSKGVDTYATNNDHKQLLNNCSIPTSEWPHNNTHCFAFLSPNHQLGAIIWIDLKFLSTMSLQAMTMKCP